MSVSNNSFFYVFVRSLRNIIGTIVKTNNYDVILTFFKELTHVVNIDINATDSDGNESILSHVYNLFFDEGLYNCKTFNPFFIQFFNKCLQLGADPRHKSFNTRYGHQYNKESIIIKLFNTIIYEFRNRLLRQDNDEDSFLIYSEDDLVPFMYDVPIDPYPEYFDKEMDDFFLMKFDYLIEILDMVFKSIDYIIPFEDSIYINKYIEFIETEFILVFPNERENALLPIQWYTSINFQIFLVSIDSIYIWSNNDNISIMRMLNPIYAVFDNEDLVEIISSFI